MFRVFRGLLKWGGGCGVPSVRVSVVFRGFNGVGCVIISFDLKSEYQRYFMVNLSIVLYMYNQELKDNVSQPF